MTELTKLIGCLINVTFQDANAPTSKKGRLISVDENFIELRTYHNTFLIRRSAIIALKTFGDGGELEK